VLGRFRRPVKASPLMQLPSNRHWDRLQPAIPLIILAIALAVRLYSLSDKPLWLDEIITQRRANLADPELLANSFARLSLIPPVGFTQGPSPTTHV
jgi:hypothetical protein